MAPRVLFCADDFWEEWGGAVRAIDPDVEVVQLIGDQRVADRDLERITDAYFSPGVWPERASSFMKVCLQAPRLEWMQSMSAGTDHPVFTAIKDRGAIVTNSAGASAPSIAETVILYLLALGRDLPAWLRDQQAHEWRPRPVRDVDGMRLGIVGMGSIGSEVARRAVALGADTIGLRRAPTGDEPCLTWSSDRLDEMLAWADAVVVTAPLTEETRGMFDAAAFARMRPGAWFVNVGRGEIVDEHALVDALRSGHVGGAGLDVFTTEPLPADSPIWDLPNVIVTPHSSGTGDQSARRAVELFLDNFRRRTDGDPLRGVI